MVNDKGPKDGAAGSPYYLGSNDNPGNIITQVQLRGPNYKEWARAMKTSLWARRKFSFIDETIKQPTEASELEDWWTVQSMLEEASVLWKDIKERFLVANGPRIEQLESELAGCRQEGLSIVSYYGKLKVIWAKLINYKQFPLCKCGKCVYDIAGRLEKKREEERVHQFLIGLEDKTYGETRSNLLAKAEVSGRGWKVGVSMVRIGAYSGKNHIASVIAVFKK
ncbi:retroelement pol polyprotein-like protein [Tanacetum coccineum]